MPRASTKYTPARDGSTRSRRRTVLEQTGTVQPRQRPSHPDHHRHEQAARNGLPTAMRNSHHMNRRPDRQARTLANAGGAVMRIVHRRPGPRRVAAGAGALGVLLLAAACSSSSASPTSGSSGSSSVINGAGSTFAAPMYQQWAGQYHQSVSNGVQINYQAVGSGGGISEFTQGVVDFGATDAPMTGTEKAAAQAGQGSVVLHIPMIIGAVALVYNEPGLKRSEERRVGKEGRSRG